MTAETLSMNGSMPEHLFNLATVLFADGCIEFDSKTHNFKGNKDITVCKSANGGTVCQYHMFVEPILHGLNFNLKKNGPFLLVHTEDARTLLELHEKGLLNYIEHPKSKQLFYSSKSSQMLELRFRFHDALMMLSEQNWSKGMRPEVIIPLLKNITAKKFF